MDPLSLIVVILVMEAVSRLIQSYNRAMQGGFLAGFMMDPDEGRQLTVSYLLYASDKIILCGNVPTSCLFGHVCGVF